MVIRTKDELKFVLKADRMMNRGTFSPSFVERFKCFFFPDYIMAFLVAMRKVSFYCHRGGVF